MSDPRRASDDLLLRLIREGKHDSEIAVRLGITTGELRERKADLRNRLGFDRYQQQTGVTPSPAGTSRRKVFLWGMAIAAGCFAILLAIANLFAGNPEEEAPARVVQTAVPTTSTVARPSEVLVAGQPFVDLGRVIVSGSTDGTTIGYVSNRLALSAIDLQTTSYLGNSEFVSWTITSASRTDAFLRGTLADRQIDLALYTDRPGGRLRTVSAGVGPLLEVDADRNPFPVTILITVTQGGAPIAARFTESGHLLLALTPIATDRAFDAYNGSELDVSSAQPFGRIAVSVGANTRNGCDPSTLAPAPASVNCRFSWLRSNRGFSVPFDGTYSCSGARSLRYEGGGIRLEFILVGQSTANFACPPSPVAAGAVIIPDGEWIVAASSIETSRPLAVVVALNGQVYVGDVLSSAACPCLPQPT